MTMREMTVPVTDVRVGDKVSIKDSSKENWFRVDQILNHPIENDRLTFVMCTTTGMIAEGAITKMKFSKVKIRREVKDARVGRTIVSAHLEDDGRVAFLREGDSLVCLNPHDILEALADLGFER